MSGGDINGSATGLAPAGGTITPTVGAGFVGPLSPGQTRDRDWSTSDSSQRSLEAQYGAVLAEQAAAQASMVQGINNSQGAFTAQINNAIEAAAAFQQLASAQAEYGRVVASTDWGATAFNAATTAMAEYTSDQFELINIAMTTEEAFDRLDASVETTSRSTSPRRRAART